MRTVTFAVLLTVATTFPQTSRPTAATNVDEETLRHFQALVRMDTADPPGTSSRRPILKKIFDAEGIPAQIVALEPKRPSVIARLKGSGRKRPILIMGHSDVVNVDPKKWTHPPFSATRDGGYLRPWDGGRQRQSRRRSDGHADAQAAERRARP